VPEVDAQIVDVGESSKPDERGIYGAPIDAKANVRELCECGSCSLQESFRQWLRELHEPRSMLCKRPLDRSRIGVGSKLGDPVRDDEFVHQSAA
jgi:hypothetical protein